MACTKPLKGYHRMFYDVPFAGNKFGDGSMPKVLS